MPTKMKKAALTIAAITLLAVALIMGGGPMAGADNATKTPNYPAKITIDNIKGDLSPVEFNHAAHVEMAGTCGQCHHQHGMEPGKQCMECHEIGPEKYRASAKNSFLGCSNCHSEQSGEAPEMPGLKVAYHKKCFSCHVGMAGLGETPKACAELCHTKK